MIVRLPRLRSQIIGGGLVQSSLFVLRIKNLWQPETSFFFFILLIKKIVLRINLKIKFL